jgi:hypothetical protein
MGNLMTQQIGKFTTFIVNTLIGVFVDTEDNALNDWTMEHVQQGFTWRKRSVSFGTVRDSGEIEVTLEITTEPQLHPDAQRIIQVPFEIDSDKIAVSEAVNFFEFNVPEGKYKLLFQHGWNDGEDAKMWCIFSFVPQEKVNPEILKADSQITIPDEYLMQALPAY